jgi:intergrase/recombinase
MSEQEAKKYFEAIKRNYREFKELRGKEGSKRCLASVVAAVGIIGGIAHCQALEKGIITEEEKARLDKRLFKYFSSDAMVVEEGRWRRILGRSRRRRSER